MKVAELKEELRTLTDKGNPELLELLLEVAKEYSAEDFSKPGMPMSKDELLQRIRSAKSRIDSGEFISMDELEKEIKN